MEIIKKIGVADINSDGVLDLLLLYGNISLKRLSDKGGGAGWEMAEVFGRQTEGIIRLPTPCRPPGHF